jgi:hypothetical protein
LSFADPAIVLYMFMLSFIDPAIVLSMFMLSFIFYSVWSFWVDADLCRFFIICLYLFLSWRLNYKRYIQDDPINWFYLPHFCACPKQESGFPMSYVVVFFAFKCWRWKVVVRFVDISGIVGHHCLIFLFIKVCVWESNSMNMIT